MRVLVSTVASDDAAIIVAFLVRNRNIIRDYASSIGLTCSTEKSEYVVITHDIARGASEYRGMVSLPIAGKPLPRRFHKNIGIRPTERRH